MRPDASARIELTWTPVLVFGTCVYIAAYSSVNPRLFPFRLWFIALALESIWFLCTNYAFLNPWLNTINFGVCAVGFTIFMKLAELAALDEPPKYNGQLACLQQKVFCQKCASNTISYIADNRCLHWNNDNPFHIPLDTRRDNTHLEFYTDTLLLFLRHTIYLDTLHSMFGNVGTLGLPQGDTIFRDTFAITSNCTIHLPHQLIGAMVLSAGVGLVIINSMSAGHYLIMLLAAPLTWLPPSISPCSLPASSLKKEWPPLFDRPTHATSLRDFWSNRWHAVFRRNFSSAGWKPASAIGKYAGDILDRAIQSKSVRKTRKEETRKSGQMSALGARLGGVVGAFLMSGLLHDFGMWGMGKGVDFSRVTGYFLIQAAGLVLEGAFGLGVRQEGSRADNASVSRRIFMKLWMVVWVIFPATMMIDAWMQRGLAGVVIIPHNLSPARALLKVFNNYAFGG